MPQMSPMSWLFLYFMFFTLFILSMIFNYYTFIYLPNKFNLKLKTTKKINWKW